MPAVGCRLWASLDRPVRAMTDPSLMIARGRRVLATEAAAVAALEHRLDDSFARACRRSSGLHGPGRRHRHGQVRPRRQQDRRDARQHRHARRSSCIPAEAIHGDIGMITRGRRRARALELRRDGRTADHPAGHQAPRRAADRDDRQRRLHAGALRDRHARRAACPAEACPLNLAPTASTTATLAMGDALAIAVLEARGFTEEDFARSHPGGSLGRRLLLHVEDVMRKGDDLPRVGPDTPLERRPARDEPQGPRHDHRGRRRGPRARRLHRRRPAAHARPTARHARHAHGEVMTDEVQGRRTADARRRGRAPDGDASHHRPAGRASMTTAAGRRAQRPRPAARGCHVTQHDPALLERARRVRLLVLDVDGVLTDGRLYISAAWRGD